MMKQSWKYLAVPFILAMIPLYSVQADSEKGQTFECKIKNHVSGSKKKNVDVTAVEYADETDILKDPEGVEVELGKDIVFVAVGVQKDDECKKGKGNPPGESACRTIVYLKVNKGDASVGFANNASKVGALDGTHKVSCVRK